MTRHLTEEEQWYRDEFCQEFDRTIEELRAMPPVIQASVGQDLLLASQLFFEEFDSVNGFMACSLEQRLAYIESMVAFEDKVAEEGSNVAFAFGLFRMWVCATSQEDDALGEWFSSALNYFMDLGRQVEFEDLVALEQTDPSQRH